jgi:hypothetical protein
MKTKITFIFLLFQFLSLFVVSQISGIVQDSLSLEKMQFCTVKLVDSTNKLLAVTLTDENGKFIINYKSDDFYQIKINFAGYKTYEKTLTNVIYPMLLDTILLAPDLISLNEIIVNGNTTYKEVLDKTVVVLSEKIIKTKPNIFQALNTVPGIDIDTKTKNISVFGSSNSLVLINGVIKSNYDLSEIKTKDIEKIEIITNPGAKYQSEYSAVINIITKQLLQKGFSADFSTELYLPFIYNFTDINLQYGFDKIKIYAFYHLFLRKSKELKTSEINNVNYQIFDTIIDNGKRNQINQYFKLGLDYFINKKNNFSFFSTYGNYKQFIPLIHNATTYYQNNTLNSFIINKQNNSYNHSNTYSLYFKHLFKNNAKFDIYSTYNNTFLSKTLLSDGYFFDNTGEKYYKQKNFFIYNKNSLLLMTNFNLEHTKYSIDMGLNYYYRDILNTTGTIDSNLVINNFENRVNFYFTISKKIKKLSFNIALNQEISKNNSDSKTNYFFLPSFFITYNIDSKHSISLSYARKITYPETNKISNNYIYTTDSLTFFINNKNLKISETNRFQLSYSYKKDLFFLKYIMYCDYTQKPIQYIITQKDAYTFISENNIGYSLKYGSQILSKISLFNENFNITPSFNIFNLCYNYNSFDLAFDFNLNADYLINSGFDFFINFSYESKKTIFMGYTTSLPYVDFGVSKSFFNEKLNIMIDINPFDNFYTKKYIIGESKIFETEKEYYKNIFIQINYYFDKGYLKKSSRNNTEDKDF